MTKREYFIIGTGWLGIILNLTGVLLSFQQLTLAGLLVQRLSGGAYNSYLGKGIGIAYYLPLAFGLISVALNSVLFTYLELASASICYQVSAVEIFRLKRESISEKSKPR